MCIFLCLKRHVRYLIVYFRPFSARKSEYFSGDDLFFPGAADIY